MQIDNIKYYNKYLNYKSKYLNRTIGTLKDNKYSFTKVDLYLFFDLMEVSYEIATMTTKEDLCILIGDTPSYLKPFLENLNRKIFNLPFSNKPYGCTWAPYGCTWAPYGQFLNDEKYYVHIPTKKNERLFFNYLNKKTILSKEFMRKTWNNIILIDTLSGQYIHGVSIFFNRYVGDIKLSNKCHNITGSKPLKFIRLSQGDKGILNIAPTMAKKISKDWLYKNYNPRLIIIVGSVPFYHGVKFFIMDAYPRYIPWYDIRIWNEDPYERKGPDHKIQREKEIERKKALNNISLLNKLFKLYVKFKNYTTDTNKDSLKAKTTAKNILIIIKKMPLSDKEDNKMLNNIKVNDYKITSKLTKLFEQISNRMMSWKYSMNWIEKQNIIIV